MSLPDSTLRLILLDLLFLALAGTLAFWFRAWLREQKRELDRRLASHESQQRSLALLSERLGNLCRTLERPAPAAAEAAPRVREAAASLKAAGTVPRPAATPGEVRASGPASGSVRRREEIPDADREAYRRARDLLEQGLPPAEICRRVGLRMTDVNVLKRMREAGRR